MTTSVIKLCPYHVHQVDGEHTFMENLKSVESTLGLRCM
jgi:hypothetical protein